MKKIIPALILAFVSLCFVSCNSGKSSDSYLLKMRLAKGDKFSQNIVTDMNMNLTGMGMTKDMKMKMEIGTDFKVLDSSTAGKDLQMTYTKMNMTMDMGNPATKAMTDSVMKKNSSEIIGKSVTITLANNKVTDVKGFDKLNDSTSASGQMAAKMFTKESVNSMFGMMFSIYPNKSVKIGDTWKAENQVDVNGISTTVLSTYKLLDVKDAIAEISVDGTIQSTAKMTGTGQNIDMTMSGDQKGKMYVTVSTGYLDHGQLNMNITAMMEMMGQKMPMKIKATYSLSGK